MTWTEFSRKLLFLLQSRKWWALVTSLVTIAAGYSTGELPVWAAVTAAVGALSAYSIGTGLDDGGQQPPAFPR